MGMPKTSTQTQPISLLSYTISLASAEVFM